MFDRGRDRGRRRISESPEGAVTRVAPAPSSASRRPAVRQRNVPPRHKPFSKPATVPAGRRSMPHRDLSGPGTGWALPPGMRANWPGNPTLGRKRTGNWRRPVPWKPLPRAVRRNRPKASIKQRTGGPGNGRSPDRVKPNRARGNSASMVRHCDWNPRTSFGRPALLWPASAPRIPVCFWRFAADGTRPAPIFERTGKMAADVRWGCPIAFPLSAILAS